MKQMYDFEGLTAEVERLEDLKRDFVADTRRAYVNNDGIDMSLGQFNGTMNDHMIKQMCTWSDTPFKYVETMRNRGQNELVAANLNTWLQNPPESRSNLRLFRGYEASGGNNWRSFHSDRYRIFDNFDLLEGIMPVLEELDKEVDGLKFVSCGLTDQRLYLKIIFPGLEGEVAVGDTVQSGVTISNSEIGLGAIAISRFLYRLVCLNGMTVPDSKARSTHLDQAQSEGEIDYKSDTKDAMNEALKKQLRDHVQQATDREVFDRTLDMMKDLANTSEADDPEKTLEVIGEKFYLTEVESKKARRSLFSNGSYNAWGMVNAITHVANEAESYDRATEIENIGGKVIDLVSRRWETLAKAA